MKTNSWYLKSTKYLEGLNHVYVDSNFKSRVTFISSQFFVRIQIERDSFIHSQI